MKKIDKNALYLQAADLLRESIQSERLKPGQWVDEQELAKLYGISRTPMREALKVLHSEGLVTLKPRQGCYVTRLNHDDVINIFAVMASLEGESAYEAVSKLTSKTLDELKRLHAVLEKHAESEDLDRYFTTNFRFHDRIHELSTNPWLTRTINELRKSALLLSAKRFRNPERLISSLEEHRIIMSAVLEGDPEASRRAMHDHFVKQGEAIASDISG